MIRISKILIFTLILLVIPDLSLAGSAHYFYDDAGRLVRVATGTEGLIYRYDAVGNLLSINKDALGTGSPILQSIQPDVLFIGQTTSVTITGQNLFTTKECLSINYNTSKQKGKW